VRFAIETHALTKQYGSKNPAVSSLEIQVEDGEIFGLLGPNGAGKTTTVKMLTTLLRPSSGSATVHGLDVVEDAARVRKVINYIPQLLTADDTITGYENLLFFAKLYGLARTSREKMIGEALDLVGLSERANDIVSSYSGGMKRRLELATVLVNRPKVLFLDEPTLGLDPRSRIMIWDFLLKMQDDYATTILVTTNYMDEADRLCDNVAIMDLGKIMVRGRPSDLKSSVGGDVVSLVTNASDAVIEELIKQHDYIKAVEYADGSAKFVLEGRSGKEAAPSILSDMKDRGCEVASISIQRASLDDVFTTYTGKSLEEEVPMGGPIKVVNRARLLKGMRV